MVLTAIVLGIANVALQVVFHRPSREAWALTLGPLIGTAVAQVIAVRMGR